MPLTSNFISDEIGNADDCVSIVLGQDKILYAESWYIEQSVLAQPMKWSVRLGFGEDIAVGMFYRYRPRTPFVLSILGAPQATGVIDSRRLEISEGGGTSLIISGRDSLAPLYDSYIEAAQSFSTSGTYIDMIAKVLNDRGIDPKRLVPSNDNNRRLSAGVQVDSRGDPRYAAVDQIVQGVPGTLGAAFAQQVQSKVNGERWLEFLRKQLDRAGLMLWAGGDGSIILATPNAGQTPTYRLFRDRSQTAGGGDPHDDRGVDGGTNILSCAYEDNAAGRHSRAGVYGRGGGRKDGRVKVVGSDEDGEMNAETGYGYDQALISRDPYIQTGAQAKYWARRKLAEERREGWHLEYTFAGHTLPWGNNGSQRRAVVVPDTTIWVDDGLTGLQGVFYIETVRRERKPQTVTTIRLCRPEDMVFGDISAPLPTPTATAKPKTGSPLMFKYAQLPSGTGSLAPEFIPEVPQASFPASFAGGSNTGGTP